MSDSHRVSAKYLETYAEPERAFSRAVSGVYPRVLVVPAFREDASLLDGYAPAIAGVSGKTLIILVVNGAEDSPNEAQADNTRLLEAVLARASNVDALVGPHPAWLARCDGFDVVLVDRASPAERFAAKQGVGLARKIGCDLALALHLDGKLTSPWIHSTDADVTLTADYFRQTEADDAASAGTALLFPYTHVAGGDPELDWATALYEVSLRYYVLGLAHARSPYAFHTIGSTLAVRAGAYARVRGFPRRLAGEDFYLLDKLSKVGPIRRAHGGCVHIAARWSDRAPFGTGRGVRRIAEERALGQQMRLYDPRAFDALGACVAGLEAFCATRRLDALDAAIEPLPSDLRGAVAEHMTEQQFSEALVRAARESSDHAHLLRRVRTWFDGLRTLKLVHAVRARVAPDTPWSVALAEAPFCRGLPPDLAPPAVAAALGRRELELPSSVGPTTA